MQYVALLGDDILNFQVELSKAHEGRSIPEHFNVTYANLGEELTFRRFVRSAFIQKNEPNFGFKYWDGVSNRMLDKKIVNAKSTI